MKAFSTYQRPARLKQLFLSLGLSACIGLPTSVWALTAANTLIRNQASATFKDETGKTYSVTSNLVETLVQQVAGLDLVQDQSKRSQAGNAVQFPHVVTNVGNGDDTIDLQALNLTGEQYDFSSLTFYADTNQDGQADDLDSPITQTPLLKAGESFAFTTLAQVPSSANAGEAGSLQLTATSQFNPSLQVHNQDTVTITDQAVIEVSKAMSQAAGLSGSGPYTITLTYQNISDRPATNVTLIDALPAGMTYVDGSGRWSEAGALVLSDTNPNDIHQSVGLELRYCAYDSSCTGLTESSQDADNDSTNQVTAIISLLPAGAYGSIRFQVMIASGLSVSTLTNIAEYHYYDGSGQIPVENTNHVPFTIQADLGVVTNGSTTDSTDLVNEPITVASVEQGGTVLFTDYVWNTGNGPDSFDLSLSANTFPAGTSLHLYQADGFTPLLDSNNNGIPDTGLLSAGESIPIVIKAQLPAGMTGDNSGNGYQVILTATSYQDTSLSNPALNQLGTINDSQVDLTNQAALAQLGVLGVGPGPEASPVSIVAVDGGQIAQFILYVNNTSAITDNYDLSVSTDSSFTNLDLPAGWQVTFTDNSQKSIRNTGIIAPGAAKRVLAQVHIPTDAVAETVSLYFRVVSPITGSSDIKHDAVTINELTDLVLEPNNQGQVLPGGVIIYSHTLSNQGNLAITNISLNQTDNQGEWASELYSDTNGDGIFNAGDIRITAIPNLDAGDSVTLFVKVHAPANAAPGAANTTALTATWDNGNQTTQAEDLTTVNTSDVAITKQQALDIDCNGSADHAFSSELYAAAPRQCVIYRLIALNTGTETVLNVRIQDAAPAFTRFITVGSLPHLSQGSLVTPITTGTRGTIIGAMGAIEAGATATLTFGVRID